MKSTTGKMLQWHSAFQASIQIEFEEEQDKLSFEPEHLLSKKPVQIDELIIKVKPNFVIHKNIGKIFRGHNIIEYKSPRDYLTVNDFYKTTAYAFFTSQIQKKLVPQGAGIYYLKNFPIPIQILITKELDPVENIWLRSLRTDIKDPQEIQKIIKCYERKRHSKLRQAAMEVITRANWNTIKEVKEKMCEALKELMAEEFEEVQKQGIEQGIKALVSTCKALGVSVNITVQRLVAEFDIALQFIKIVAAVFFMVGKLYK